MNKKNILTKKIILKEVAKVMDPELNISLIDLGLIYDVKFTKKGKVNIVMTLTSMGCPLFEVMADDIKAHVKNILGVKEVLVELVFNPPWEIDKMSKKAKVSLGLD